MISLFRFLGKIDLIIFLPALSLACFGLLMIYSFSSNNDISVFYRQLLSLIIGVVVFLVLVKLDFKNIVQLIPVFYVLVVLLLLTTMFFGEEIGGAVRWIDLGVIRIQASELAKPVLALTLAVFFSKNQPENLRNIFASIIIILVPVLLVVLQPDLGSAVLLVLLWSFSIFVAGLSPIFLFSGMVGLVLLVPLVWRFLQDYQKVRILTFMNPNLDPQGASYNIVQALIAFGSGQLLGRGIGRGTQSHLDFLPAESTDFMFAFIGEELGFLGISIVILIFSLLIFRLVVVANRLKNVEASLFVFTAAFIIFIQFFVNSGVNTGLLPVTGITLPFVSFGGSSIVSLFIILGLVNSALVAYKQKDDTVFAG